MSINLTPDTLNGFLHIIKFLKDGMLIEDIILSYYKSTYSNPRDVLKILEKYESPNLAIPVVYRYDYSKTIDVKNIDMDIECDSNITKITLSKKIPSKKPISSTYFNNYSYTCNDVSVSLKDLPSNISSIEIYIPQNVEFTRFLLNIANHEWDRQNQLRWDDPKAEIPPY
jgi:hypothetical protein